MKDGADNQIDDAKSSRTRAEFRSPESCANKLWTAALAKVGTDDESANVWLEMDGLGEPRPSDWAVVYTIKQLLMMPEFLSTQLGLKNFPEEWTSKKVRERLAVAAEPYTHNSSFKLSNVDEVLSMPSAERGLSAVKALANAQFAYRQAFTELLNSWRDSPGAELTPDEVFSSKFRGANAIRDLRAVAIRGLADRPGYPKPIAGDDMGWLAQPDALADKMLTFHVGGANCGRREALDRIRKKLFSDADEHILVNCYGPGMRSGLSALATELFEPRHRKKAKCKLPMLYVAIHGRNLTPPDDSFPALLWRIRNFYLGLSNPMKRADIPRRLSASRLVEIVAEIRVQMAKTPAIIVFDGHRPRRFDAGLAEYSLHNLTGAIAGDQLLDLLDQLLLAPTPTENDSIDIARFVQNRFVITSDTALFDRAGENDLCKPKHPHPALKLVRGVSIEVPPPHPNDIPELLPTFGNQSPKQIAMIRNEIGAQAPAGDTDLSDAFEQHCSQLLEQAKTIFDRVPQSESVYAVLSVLNRLGCLRGPLPQYDMSDSDALTTLISKELIPGLRDTADQTWLTMLHLIAIAPGGVRPKTLARAFETFVEASKTEPKISRSEINASIAALLETCNGIVGLCRSDGLEALSGLKLPLLFRERFSAEADEIPSDRAIMFAALEIRDALVADACEIDNGRYVSFLHFLLAEEALDQCVHIGRYDEFQAEESLYRNTRLLAALYHGAASLQDATLSSQPLHEGIGRFLPDDPQQRWIKLYAFLFRKMLDRPPLYALIRQHDAAGMKLDLLLILWKPELWRSRGAIHGSKLPVLTGTEAGTKRVLREFEVDLRKAASKALGRLTIFPHSTSSAEDGDSYRFRDTVEATIQDTSLEPQFHRENAVDVVPSIVAHIEGNFLKGVDVENHIAKLAGVVYAIVTDEGQAAAIDEALQAFTREATALDEKRLKLLADLLNLIGETVGVEADRLQSAEAATETKFSETVAEGFSRSYAAYALAEALRHTIFKTDPSGARDTMSGSAGRGFFRTCLKLEKLRQLWRQKKRQPFETKGWFWLKAHQIGEELTRYLSAYPRERAGMLILDSALARHCLSKSEKELADGDLIQMARESLRKCEQIILKLSRHSRLRQRFALERSKVMALCATYIVEKDPERARMHLALAMLDIKSVMSLTPSRNQLWTKIAEVQERQLKALDQLIPRRT